MSFLTVASSIQSAAPVELYTFTRGSQIWRYSSSAASITYDGNTYEPYPIQRGRITQTQDMFKNLLEFTFPRGSTFAMYYIQYPSVQITTVQIIRGFPESADYQSWWRGRVIGARISGNKITMECEPIYTSLKRSGLREVYETTCSHSLYEEGCDLDKSVYERSVDITAIDGKVITVDNMSGVDDYHFSGGMIINSDGKAYFISVQDGADLSVFLIPELVAGETLSIYPGCDHLASTCKDKFNNKLNFNGFEWMPDVNPYEGMSME